VTSDTKTEAGTAPVSVIPAELRERPQWVCWRYETRDGKPTKIPYSPITNTRASSTEPATWTTFEHAIDASTNFDGVGYVFASDDPFTGVDFDDCLAEDRLDPHVAAHLRTLDSFTEISPSGRGVKTIVHASKNGFARCRTSKTPWNDEFECYDTGRFWTITCNPLRGTPTTIMPRQAELERVLAHVFGEPNQKPPQIPTDRICFTDDDGTLLELARGARNGGKLEQLWAGDTAGYSSESEADLALVSMLAFWAGPDPDRIDALYRKSGLARAKWNRDDYRARTIERALEGMTDFYTGVGDEPDLTEYLARVSSRPSATPGSLTLEPLARIRSRAVEWLLPGLIPIGTVTLVAGVRGLGKSTQVGHRGLLDDTSFNETFERDDWNERAYRMAVPDATLGCERAARRD